MIFLRFLPSAIPFVLSRIQSQSQEKKKKKKSFISVLSLAPVIFCALVLGQPPKNACSFSLPPLP